MKEDRDFHNQVKGTVSIRFGVLDIIFSPDECDIILLQKSIRQHIDVGDKGAYDPHAGDVIDALFQIFGIQGYISGRSFLKDTLGLLSRVFIVSIGLWSLCRDSSSLRTLNFASTSIMAQR